MTSDSPPLLTKRLANEAFRALTSDTAYRWSTLVEMAAAFHALQAIASGQAVVVPAAQNDQDRRAVAWALVEPDGHIYRHRIYTDRQSAENNLAGSGIGVRVRPLIFADAAVDAALVGQKT